MVRQGEIGRPLPCCFLHNHKFSPAIQLVLENEENMYQENFRERTSIMGYCECSGKKDLLGVEGMVWKRS